MNTMFLIASLILTSQAFAENRDYEKSEAKAVISLTGAENDAKSIRACILKLSSEEASANSAQIVEVTNIDGKKNTVVYFKSVSSAGRMQSIKMQIYPDKSMLDTVFPGKSIGDSQDQLTELAKSFKTESLSLGDCYEF